MKLNPVIWEFVRFGLVGGFCTALHYGIYFLLQFAIEVNVAYTVGYLLSFIANFYLTSYLLLELPRRGGNFLVWPGRMG